MSVQAPLAITPTSPVVLKSPPASHSRQHDCVFASALNLVGVLFCRHRHRWGVLLIFKVWMRRREYVRSGGVCWS